MKRFHILTMAALIFSASVVIAYDCNADVATRPNKSLAVIAPGDGVQFSAIDLVKQSFINDADILCPVFVSNFNRLVVFPEIGSKALCEGVSSVARGPPKS